MGWRSDVLLLMGALAMSACVGGPPDDHAPRERLAAYIVDQPPSEIGERLDIDYGGKVVLLGAKVEPAGAVRPGQTVKLTLYWRANARVGAGWNLFTHLLDGAGERIANLDHVGPLRRWQGDRQVYGPWAWEPGKTYIDEQEFTIPKVIRTDRVQVVTGLWKGPERLPIRSGRRDRHDRGIAAELNVGGVGAAAPAVVQNTRVPRLRVDKLPPAAKVVIDGKLAEAEWTRAAFTGEFRDVSTGQPNRRRDLGGNARLLWDDAAMYVGITITDHDVVGGFDPKEADPHLWTRDTAEIMIDPDGDGDNLDYYEIQINPQNLVFDSRFDSYNQPVKRPDGPFGHEAWSARLRSAVVVNGGLDDQGKDQGYVIEARIVWEAFDRAKHVPPRVGDEWRINFYAIERNSGVAWSPILRQGNFHKASRFGRVLWAEKGWLPPGVQAAPSASLYGRLRPSASSRGPLKLAPRRSDAELP